MSEKQRTPRAQRTGRPIEVGQDGSIKIKDPRRAKIEFPDFKGDSAYLTQQMVVKYQQLGYEIEKNDGFTITMGCSIENVKRLEQEFQNRALQASDLVHGERRSPTQGEMRDGAVIATVQKLSPVNIGDFATKTTGYNTNKEAEINEALAPHVAEIAARMFDMGDD